MIKKSLFFSFFLFSIIKAQITIPSKHLSNIDLSNQISSSQKSIKTYSDYLEFKKSIEKMAVFEPSRVFFILGSLYMKEFKFKNKIIRPDLDKALIYFKKSFKNGNVLAAYYVSLLENKKGNIYESLIVLQKALHKLSPKDKLYSIFAIEYASIVLDNLKDDKDSLKKAIGYIQNVDSRNYAAAYLLANLLYFLGPQYTQKASMLLNYACTNTRDKELLKQCQTNPYIKGNEIKINCPIASKQER